MSDPTAGFAFLSGTLEIVILASLVVFNVDGRFEEAVDGRTPAFLETGCIVMYKAMIK